MTDIEKLELVRMILNSALEVQGDLYTAIGDALAVIDFAGSPDPKGKRGPVGLCPRCGRQKIKWNPLTDVSRCEFCGWTNGIKK